MRRFYLALLAGLFIITACTKKNEEITYPEGKIGEWSVNVADSNYVQIGLWDLVLYRNADTLTGQLCNETLSGLVVGDSLIFTIGDSTSGNPVTYRGRIIDKDISGTYHFQNGGGGTWSGINGYMHQNYNRYYVFGGNVPYTYTEEVGMHPERFGFKVLGSGKLTATFAQDYPYYIIVSYPDNTSKIDAVGSDGIHYYESNFNAHAYDHQNIGTGPDGKYAVIGKAGLPGESGPGGFVGIDASSIIHTGVTVYIAE